MNNETIKKRLKETTAPPSVIDAVSALIAENDVLRAAIDRNINNAVTIANYTDDMIVIEMAHNIVNDLGAAYGITED